MLSRVADSLYWMSRYMERTDSMLRMLKVNYASSQDDVNNFTWGTVLKIFTYLEGDEAASMERKGRDVLCHIVTNRENPNSVYNIVVQARENARSVQDNVTIELWQCLNDYYHLVREPWIERSLRSNDPVGVLDALIKQGMLYYGIVDYTMFRGEGLSFMNLGKYLERSLQSTDILDVKFSDLSYDLEKPTDTTYWKYLLLSISGYALYLKSYRSGFEAKNVVDQILFNVDFPRSLAYSMALLQRNFDRLKSNTSTDHFNQVQFMIGKLYSRVKYSNVQSVARAGLHTYLKETHDELHSIGQSLNQLYFAYT
ncbi:MAG TPA: alpha-E domain-containing protein [Cyclobacteriaceae bacterium]|nr:alpha-E domain-containing protein [Cyclobacteriaceae bacterium]